MENKFYFLRETNTPEEFEYIVGAELRRGTTGEFGLPAKELFRRMGERFRKIFKQLVFPLTTYVHILTPC